MDNKIAIPISANMKVVGSAWEYLVYPTTEAEIKTKDRSDIIDLISKHLIALYLLDKKIGRRSSSEFIPQVEFRNIICKYILAYIYSGHRRFSSFKEFNAEDIYKKYLMKEKVAL